MDRRQLLVTLWVTGWLAACATPVERLQPPDLLADAGAFGPLEQALAPHELLAVDDAMRQYAAVASRGKNSPANRLQAILDGLFRPGEFSLDYEADLSLTAAETFRLRRGNCLSSTALLVALAREAGLRAHFQDFDRRPLLRVDEDIWIHEKHINALVRFRNRSVVVDFDRRAELAGPGRVVEDGVAIAQFFSNRGVQAMREGKLALAHARFRQALSQGPELAYVWNNAGVLYRRVGLLDRAEAIFRYALYLSPDEYRAMSNLASLYRQTDRPEAAQALDERLERVRRNNPYYLFTLARRAYRQDDLDASEQYLRRAIALKDDEPEFQQLLDRIISRRH